MPKVLAVLLFALSVSPAVSEITVLGIDGRPSHPVEYAIVAGKPLALRLFVPENLGDAGIHAELFQFAGGIAQPLACEFTINSSPGDSRIRSVGLTPPAVERITRFVIRIRNGGVIKLIVYPAPKDRVDRVVLADVLASSGRKIAVCGKSAQLRAFLKTHALEFEDHGPDFPETLASETLLIGELSPGDWKRLAALPVGGELLGFVDDVSHLPGVFSYPQSTKVTLPLLSDFSSDPRAEETLFNLILTALTPSHP